MLDRAFDIVAGVIEETVGQAEYRSRLAEARHVADQHLPAASDDGFIGDGRLARVQADCMS